MASYHRLSNTNFASGDPEDALHFLDATFEVLEQEVGEDCPELLNAFKQLKGQEKIVKRFLTNDGKCPNCKLFPEEVHQTFSTLQVLKLTLFTYTLNHPLHEKYVIIGGCAFWQFKCPSVESPQPDVPAWSGRWRAGE